MKIIFSLNKLKEINLFCLTNIILKVNEKFNLNSINHYFVIRDFDV